MSLAAALRDGCHQPGRQHFSGEVLARVVVQFRVEARASRVLPGERVGGAREAAPLD